MKKDWTYKKLGEIGTFQRGGGFLKNDFVEEGFPCIHYGQIHTKFGVSVDKHLTCISDAVASKSKIAHNNDLIIAITSEDVECSCKCTAWLGGYDIAIGAHTAIYSHNQNAKYLAYVLRSRRFNEDKTKYAHGFKVVEIKPSDIAKIEIPIAPLEEQQQIVAELDLLSEMIEKQKAQIEELDKLSQSIFYDMFGDPESNACNYPIVKLEELCSIITKGTTPTTLGFHFVDEGINFIKVESFNKDESINLHNVAHITEECHKALKRSILEEDDILICIAGTCGRLAIVPPEALPANTNQAFAIVRLKDKENLLSYIYNYLHTSYIRRQIDDLKKGVAQPNLTLNQIRNLLVLLPPLSLQQEFAAKIEAIEAMKAKVRQSLKESETLFNSRMDYYFN